jgi:hypothetical protein
MSPLRVARLRHSEIGHGSPPQYVAHRGAPARIADAHEETGTKGLSA